jgi:propanol-preferring alcohol dehydrogenase
MLLVVLAAKTIDSPYAPTDVGNRQDAIEALDFAARGKVKPQIVVEPLKNLPEGKAVDIFFRLRCRTLTRLTRNLPLRTVYKRMEAGAVSGRIVLKC